MLSDNSDDVHLESTAIGWLPAPATKKVFYFSNFSVPRQFLDACRCLGPAQLAP